jgi:APA family basic amino acid/polyamine antiporter
VLYVMSCDGLFFKRFTQVNEGGTPVSALILSTAVGVAFVLGSFERVIAMLSFFFVANYTLSYTSLFVLRRKEPDTLRPYRAWGYPWTPGIALACSIAFLVGSVALDHENAPLAVLIFIACFPIYKFIEWRRRAALQPDAAKS